MEAVVGVLVVAVVGLTWQCYSLRGSLRALVKVVGQGLDDHEHRVADLEERARAKKRRAAEAASITLPRT